MKRYRAIAEYYDAENESHAMLEQDVPFFLGHLPRRRQSVLELAAGTGRAAIPIAQAGHRVVGVDYAPDVLAIAERKRDAVGLRERELRLVRADILKLDLGERFDWICIFFNTFLNFTTLKEQDRLLQRVRTHLKPRGRFWMDVFLPNPDLLVRPARDIEPQIFHVHSLNRTAMKTTQITPHPAGQMQHVTFHFTWIDEYTERHEEKVEMDLTYFFPRELQMLLERNGLKLERMYGNYDGSKVNDDSPRMIALCCLA